MFLAINFFFETSRIPKAWGRTYVGLIPKIDHPKKVFYYHSILLCNVCYKIITKMLANHLKGILGRLISREQSGFVSNRTPTDNIIAI